MLSSDLEYASGVEVDRLTSSSGKKAKAKHQDALESRSLMSTIRLGPLASETRCFVSGSRFSRDRAMSPSLVSGSRLRRSRI